MAENSPAKPRARVNWTAAERAEWLALFEKSGRTAAEFCRHNDLSPATLSFGCASSFSPVSNLDRWKFRFILLH